jgi:hypothetical protein
MEFNLVKTQEDIDYLLNKFHDFHDSCIVSVNYKSGAYVDKSNFSMNPLNTARTLSVIFQSQFKDCYSIEIVFNKLVKFKLEPHDENYDCIIFDAMLKKVEDLFLWSDSSESCCIMSQELMWRFCEE